MKKWIGRIALGLAAIVLLIAITGWAYEAVGRRDAAREFPVPGRLVDIGGRRIQLDCRGTGSPTVVFEAGLDMGGSLSWYGVHDSIAKTTRACAYSRAGIMWSDPVSGAQSGKGIAYDLHSALDKSGERPPYVLVSLPRRSIHHDLHEILRTRGRRAGVRGCVPSRPGCSEEEPYVMDPR